MSFLDNLENNLKNLERQDEQDTTAHRRREAERAEALASAPWAEQLKTSPYKQELMNRAAMEGHRLRAKIYMAWLGNTLRFEFKDKKLELRPTPEGIEAAFIERSEQTKSSRINFEDDPGKLLTDWLSA
jgi:hypothetical protein